MHFLAPKSSHLHPLHISPEEIRMGSSSLNLDVFSFIIAQSWGFVKPAQKVKRTRVGFSGPLGCSGFLGAAVFQLDCPVVLFSLAALRLSRRPATIVAKFICGFFRFLLKKPRKNVKNWLKIDDFASFLAIAPTFWVNLLTGHPFLCVSAYLFHLFYIYYTTNLLFWQ